MGCELLRGKSGSGLQQQHSNIFTYKLCHDEQLLERHTIALLLMDGSGNLGWGCPEPHDPLALIPCKGSAKLGVEEAIC